MSRARDIADLGQDKSTLSSYASTGVTSSEFDTLDGITSTTAELNKLDGVTADATDLNRLDISTEGTSQASKVVTADSSGHVTLAGELRGPATLVIDPAVVGNNTGLLQVKGNLQVDGTTTTINSTTLTVDDKNIVLGSGAADSAAADGSGITIDGASATMLYTHSTTSFDFNKPVNVTGGATITGNVGIGVTPEAVDTNYRALQIAGTVGLQGTATQGAGSILALTNNVYRATDQTWKYIVTDEASRYDQFDGGHVFRVAGSGSADATISFTDALTINSSGNVGIGTSSPDAFSSLHISSTGYHPLVVNTTNAGGGGMILRHSGTYKGHVGTAGSTHLSGSSTDDILVRAANKLLFASNGNNLRMQIDTSGDVTVSTGNLVIGTAGKGIDFSADSHASKMDSEILDDYETGVLDHPVSFGGQSQGSSNFYAQNSDYTKIGNKVYVNIDFDTYNNTLAAAGPVTLNLPFTTNQQIVLYVQAYMNSWNQWILEVPRTTSTGTFYTSSFSAFSLATNQRSIANLFLVYTTG